MSGFIHPGIKFAAALTLLGLAGLHGSHQLNMQWSTAGRPGDPMAPSHLTHALLTTPLPLQHRHTAAQYRYLTQSTGTCVRVRNGGGGQMMISAKILIFASTEPRITLSIKASICLNY